MVSVTSRRARVLVVDDSALVRTLLQRGLETDKDIEVVGSARDGASALEAYRRLAPDVLTLDVEMPGMDGLEVLRRLRGEPVAILLLTAARDRGCDVAVQGLTLGAFDFLQKPSDGPQSFAALIEDLCAKVKVAALAGRRRVARARPTSQTLPALRATEPRRAAGQGAPPSPRPPLRRATGRDALVVIGASTGGPEALLEVLRTMPEDAPPILIVQHMPDRFTATFARRLDSRLAVRVKEAEDGDLVRHGQVLLAPGTTRHMLLRRDAAGLVVRLEDSPAVMHHRPSVDKLFESCAQFAGRHVVAALLTGMGADGARGLLALRSAGAATIAQDEATSVVYGMPMEAVALGAAAHVLPLGAIGPALLRLSRHGASVLDQVG